MSSTTITSTPSTDAHTPSHPRRRLFGLAVLVLVLVAGGVLWATTRGSADVPYTDPRASGVLTLCDASGQPVTSGSVAAVPFVARAVGVTPVDGGAKGVSGAAATLFAYQPRAGLGAADWSGQQLTSSSTFSSAKHPIAQATTKDIALHAFLDSYPATWDGLVQLRLYLTSTTYGTAEKYDAVTVRVDGGTWNVVGKAGTASCTAGDATSLETTTLHYPPATH